MSAVLAQRTLVRAYIGPNHYRSECVMGHDVDAAIAELKRIDMVEPARPYDYTHYEITQWVAGELGQNVFEVAA